MSQARKRHAKPGAAPVKRYTTGGGRRRAGRPAAAVPEGVATPIGRKTAAGAGKGPRTGGPGPGGAGSGPPGHAARRRALRHEAPVVVGLLLDDHDFTAMTGYGTFPHDDYAHYLHQVDRMLRHLHGKGTHIAITLFDPADYADYCATTGQPADAAVTRTRYVAESTTAGPAVRYTRQPIHTVRGDLAREADRRATWERATDLLLEAGPCPDCDQDLAHCAFDRASRTLLRLIEALGPGRHHVVCSLRLDPGEPVLHAAAQIDATPPGTPANAGPGDARKDGAAGRDDPTDARTDGDLRFSDADMLVVCTVMTAAEITGRTAGLVIRTTTGPQAAAPPSGTETGTETVRGWSLRGGRPHPLSAADVFNAYCTDPVTGEPVPPEPAVRYRAGLPLPPPLPGDLA